MEDDWEAEDFVPPAPSIAREQPKSLWDDEDAGEEEDVKDSWEDEEKPEPDPVPGPEPEPEPVKPTESQREKVDKKKARGVKGSIPIPGEDTSNKLEEKLRQQRLVEEADYQSTTELFGRISQEHTLDNFLPQSEADFIEYAELLAHKIRPFEKSFQYLTLLKAVMRHAMTSLKAADAKEIASSITVIANEKLKAEKDAAGKKKTIPKKKQLHVDKDEDTVINAYDDVDDYDFM